MARPRKNTATAGQQYLTPELAPPQQQSLLDTAAATTAPASTSGAATARVAASATLTAEWQPVNLGKALRLDTVDFNDPNRPKTCLEVDFPILPINRLAQVEGNAGKPIYQMSKWWARRRSSVFRALMIAAAIKAPEDQVQAGKQVWDAYYANHQKAGNFKGLRVLEPFMGGGTTLVEGARLGFQVNGCDLNPIAWFVCKNELAGTDPAAVKKLFDHIEATVKPQIQPFYTTTCPRGHRGRWIDVATGAEATGIDPISLPPAERARYRWDGAEIIYTFWAKHGHCSKAECQHRTPIMGSPIVAVKELSAQCIPTTCPHCSHSFKVFLGETSMAPGCQRVNSPDEPSYTETSRRFANLMWAYGKEDLDTAIETAQAVLAAIPDEPAFTCPKCQRLAGRKLIERIEGQLVPQQSARGGNSRIAKSALDRRKLGMEKSTVLMTLCLDPRWLKGSSGLAQGQPAGGTVTSSPEANADWYQARADNLRLIEIRGAASETTEVSLMDGTKLNLGLGNIPGRSAFTCQSCGTQHDLLDATKATGRSAPTVAYTLQCHCPQCAQEGHDYSGRFFKAPHCCPTKAA